MLRTLRKAEYAELMILFFIQAAGMSMWFVPLGTILDAYGLHWIKPYAFASQALAAFISPLAFGAMADRHIPPAKVLRGLATVTAVMVAAIGFAFHHHFPAWTMLLLIQLFYLSYSPMFSISTALVLARLEDAKKEFGPIRSLATIGWMTGALLISACGLDRSALTDGLAAVVWLLVAAFTFFLPQLQIPQASEHLTWKERLGLDALSLLKEKRIRILFLTTTLLNIPICAFYPYAPAHLHDLGFKHTSAWMSLAQTTEIISMFSLGWLLLHWRLRWVFLVGLLMAVLRFVLSGWNTPWSHLLGITLHGASYVPVFITAQIYLDQQLDPAWRSRAQALLTLMNSGVGNLLGYLGTGWWLFTCSTQDHTDWPAFWYGLALASSVVMVYFLIAFKDHPISDRPAAKA